MRTNHSSDIETRSLGGLELIPVNESMAEATFRFIVPNVGRLTNKVESPPFILKTMQWRIRVIPNCAGLGVFVHCSGKHDASNWSCNATVELRLVSFCPGIESYVKGPIKHLFNAEEDDYGYAVFISWQKLLCMVDAYVTCKSIMLEVQVIADSSQGLDN